MNQATSPLCLGFTLLLMSGLNPFVSFASQSLDVVSHKTSFKLVAKPKTRANTSSGDPPGTIKVKPVQKKRQPRIPIPLSGPKGVLFYCGNGGICTEGLTQIKSYYQSLGAAPVNEVTTLPANLSSKYRLIYIVLPTVDFTAAQVTALKNFSNGRDNRLVILGDWDAFWGGTVVGNNLLTQLGVPITFNANSVDSSCNTWSTTNYGDNPLLGDLPSTGVAYALTATLNLSGTAENLLGTVTGNQPFLAAYRRNKVVGGNIVVSGDSNMFTDLCSPPNQSLWKNLFTVFDDDADGLLNDWEASGYDANNDGIVDVDLPGLGAKTKRKDTFIEIDWMVGCPGSSPSKKPLATAVTQVIDAFAIAPVPNPDGTKGVTLHVDYGQGGLLNGGNSVACTVNLNFPSGFQTYKNANFNTNRQRIFHYNLWGYGYNGGTSSGIAELPGDDFLVSLGFFPGGNGTQAQQAGTLMHEFGHNLKLLHGNTDNDNYKPNNLSVMSYSFQLSGLIFNSAFGKLDYSRFNIPALNESSLNESVGLNGGASVTPYGTLWFCGGSQFNTLAANSPIDWNCNGSSQINISADINGNGGLSTLTVKKEWPAIQLAATNRPGIPSGSNVGPFTGTQKLAQKTTDSVVPEASVYELLNIERQSRKLLPGGKAIDPTELPNLEAKVSSKGVQLTWSGPRDGTAVNSYAIYRQKNGVYPSQDELIGTTASLSFQDLTAVKGSSYAYTVVAQKAAKVPDKYWARTPLIKVR